jgi:glycosyltransferase involved in cell wall biosynthesis
LLLILQSLFLEKKVDSIIFNSMFTQAYAKKRYDVKDKGIVIHNGFTPAPEMQMQNEYALNWKQKLKDSFVIGCISRFAGVKRLDQLIYTFSLIEDQQIKLLLVGDGGLRDQLEQQVRDLGIADKVIFAGYQENTSFFYQQMDLCVIPSKHESFGLVVVEALNEGKPVLVFSDGGGMIDIVQPLNEKTIANNPSEMAQLVLHWKNHPELSINGVEARRKRANEFSISIMEAKTLKLYRDVWN